MEPRLEKLERSLSQALDVARAEHVRLRMATWLVLGLIYVVIVVLAVFLVPSRSVEKGIDSFPIHAVNVGLGLVLLTLCGKLGVAGRWLWVGSAFAVYGVLVGTSYLTAFLVPDLRALIVVYATFLLILLGLVGQLAKREDGSYQFAEKQGRRGRRADFTDENRTRLALFLPTMILDCVGESIGGSWLARGLSPEEITAAASLLATIDRRDPAPAETFLRALDPSLAGRVVRALVRLELVEVQEGILRRTAEGDALVKGWS